MSDARDRWDRFLSTPIDELAAGVMRESWIGRRFGGYEVVGSLGAGGMGEKLCSGPRDRVATHPIRNWELLREWVPRSA